MYAPLSQGRSSRYWEYDPVSVQKKLQYIAAKDLVLLFWRQEAQLEELDKMQQYLTSKLPPLPHVSVDGALVVIYLIGRVFLLKS